MSVNIDEIMEMLDWNNSEEIQEKGRQLAKEVKCFHVFIRPICLQYSKNVWDNCAMIIAEKTDEELKLYLKELFQWLEDLNWPGALCIWDRLKEYGDKERLNCTLQQCMYDAKVLKRRAWLDNLRDFQGRDVVPQSESAAINEAFARRLYEDLVVYSTNVSRQLYDMATGYDGMSVFRRNEITLYQSFDETQKDLFMEILKKTKADAVRGVLSILEGHFSPRNRMEFEIEMKINGMSTDDELTDTYQGIVNSYSRKD